MREGGGTSGQSGRGVVKYSVHTCTCTYSMRKKSCLLSVARSTVLGKRKSNDY